MPRAHHPIDGILRYFRTAPLEAADVTLAAIRSTLKDRRAVAEETAARPVRRKRRRVTPAATPPVTPAAPKRPRRTPEAVPSASPAV